MAADSAAGAINAAKPIRAEADRSQHAAEMKPAISVK